MTTDAKHGWRVVPNLARGMEPTGLDQLWVADITYVRMREEFAYLAVVLDAFSRRVVGWALETHMQASLATAALKMALKWRRPQPFSLVHHSDRGVQYACADYTQLLDEHGIAASMSRPGQSLRQRQGGELHEDAQARRSRRQRLPRQPTCPLGDRPIPGDRLQLPTAALGARLSTARRVRGEPTCATLCHASARLLNIEATCP